MIQVIENDKEYIIKMPYDMQAISLVKNVPGRRWNPEQKVWTVPKDKLGFLINQFKGTKFEDLVSINSSEQLGVNDTLDATQSNTIPDVDLSNETLYVKSGYSLYNHQLDFMKYAIARENKGNRSGFLLADQPGLGKALSLNTKIFTPDGYKTMQEIEVGDTVFNELGLPVKVLATYSHKSVNMYEITFSDNTIIECCEDHLWYVFKGNSKGMVLDTKTLLACNRFKPNSLNKYYIPNVKPIQFNADKIKIDPWLLGAMITNPNTNILDIDISDDIKSAFTWAFSKTNSLAADLEYYELLHLSPQNRFIPDEYKYNSVENRFAILQGLMDSTTHNKDSYNKFTTTSISLVKDVIFLVQSLGGIATFNKIKNQYIVNMHLDNPQDFYKYSTLKLELPMSCNSKTRRFVDIRYIGKFPAKCITVSGPSHLYVCEHFIVTHNTLQATNLALRHRNQGAKHCLVLCCINGAKYNWVNDIIEHTNGSEIPYLLGTRLTKQGKIKLGGNAEKFADLKSMCMYGDKTQPLPYFIVMNIEPLRYKIKTVYPIQARLVEMMNNGEIDMVILDEVHKNISPTSSQGKLLLDLKKKLKTNVTFLPMTGTPIVNKPTDTFLPLRLIDAHNINSAYTWNQYYCVYGGFGNHQIIGYKHIPELKNLLQTCMLRRLKSDVLDLPPKNLLVEYVENSPIQAKLYDQVLSGVINNINGNNNNTYMSAMTQFIKLRQVNGCPEVIDHSIVIDKSYLSINSKLARLIELVEDIISQNEKVIIFSNWIMALRPIYKILTEVYKYKVCMFTGEMTQELREKHKQVFQNNPDYKILLGTVGAAGTSHTFTAAQNVIFYDEPWTPADKEQCIDRAYRIGTKGTVTVTTLITKDTVDDAVHNILYKKKGISDFIVDNRLDLENSAVVASLLNL